MRRSLAILALLLPLAAAPLRAQADAATSFRAQFKPYEQWMLDVILSDPKQKALFDVDASQAQKGGEDDTRVLMKWRKTVISFASFYKKHLDTTDLIPNAPSVEKMVTPQEFNITQYYWLRKPAKDQEGFKSDIATGDNLLNWGGRGLVEGRVRKGRQTFSSDLGQYLNDPDSKAALAYVEPKPAAPAAPAPKPAPKAPEKKPADTPSIAQKPENPDGAKNQLENIAQNSTPAGTGESTSERAGSGFTGSAAHSAPPAAPTDPAPEAPAPPSPLPPAPAPSLLTPSEGTFQGGFVVAPPPAPVLDQKKTAQGGSNLLGAAVKYGPAVAGAAVFGLLGLLLGGPLIALAAAAVGAVVGHFLGKKLLS